MKKVWACFVCLMVICTLMACAETTQEAFYLGNIKYNIPSSWIYEYSKEYDMHYHWETENPSNSRSLTVQVLTVDEISCETDAELFFDSFIEAIIAEADSGEDIEVTCNNLEQYVSAASVVHYGTDNIGFELDSLLYTFWDGEFVYAFMYSNPTINKEEALIEYSDFLSEIAIATYADTATEETEPFEVVGYTYSQSKYNYLYLAVTNKTEECVAVEVLVKYFDENGGLVGIYNADERAIGSGTTVLISTSNDIPFSSYEYEITSREETLYKCADDALIVVPTILESKVIVGVTNTANKPAKFVEYNILFMNEGNVVDHEWGYATDSDSEIKPDKTQYIEESSNKSFDDVLVFVHGRSDR